MKKSRGYIDEDVRLDLIGALVSSVILGYLLWLASSSDNHNYSELVENILLAFSSYSAAVLLVHKLLRQWISQRTPKWMIVSIMGSTMLVSYYVISSLVRDYLHPTTGLKQHPNAFFYFLVFMLIYTVITLPIMGIVHGINHLFRQMSK